MDNDHSSADNLLQQQVGHQPAPAEKQNRGNILYFDSPSIRHRERMIDLFLALFRRSGKK